MEVQESDSKKKTELIGILNGTKYDNAETGVIGGGYPYLKGKKKFARALIRLLDRRESMN